MELNKYLRIEITKVRPLFIKSSCEACGETENLCLHHVKLFSEILDETLIRLNLPYKDTTEYAEDDLQLIVDVVLGKHLQIKYLTLCDKCHKEIHKDEWAFLTVNDKHRQHYENQQKEKELLRQLYNQNVLIPYLESLVGKKLLKEDRNELIEKIDFRINGRQQKSYRKINEGLEMIKLDFVVLAKKSNDKRYWEIQKYSN